MIACQLDIASWLGMGNHMYFLSVLWPHLYWTYSEPMNEFVCEQVILCLKDIISLVPSITTTSYNLSASSFAKFPDPWVGKFHGNILSGTDFWRSLILCAFSSCEDVFVPTYYRWKLPWWWLDKTLVYGYSRKSFKVFILLNIFRIKIFGFLLGLWPNESQVLGYWSSIRHGFYLMGLVFGPFRVWLVTLISFVPLSHQYII